MRCVRVGWLHDEVTDRYDHPSLDIERMIEALDRHGVRYVLVGGVAGQLYGATRPTYDLDVVAQRERSNLDRAAAALRELGAFLRVGGLSDAEARELPFILDGTSLESMEVSTWRTDAGDIDILANLRNTAGERLGFDELDNAAREVSVGRTVVWLAGLAHIIEAKRFADRDKDRDALPELERIQDEDE